MRESVKQQEGKAMAGTTLKAIEARFMQLAKQGEATSMRVLLGHGDLLDLLATPACRLRLSIKPDGGLFLDGVPVLEVCRVNYMEVVRA